LSATTRIKPSFHGRLRSGLNCPMIGPWDNLGHRAMATFEKRVGKSGKTTWRVRVRRSTGPWLTKSFPRKADGEAWARSIESKLDAGEAVPSAEARKRTLGEAIDRYLTVTLPQSRHQKSAREQTRLLTWWKGELGDRPLVGITPGVLAEVRD